MLVHVRSITFALVCVSALHAQSWGARRIGFALTPDSDSVGLLGSPPSTLSIGPGAVLTPENQGLTGNLYGLTLLGPNLLTPVVKGRVPGGPPGTGLNWTLRDRSEERR